MSLGRKIPLPQVNSVLGKVHPTWIENSVQNSILHCFKNLLLFISDHKSNKYSFSFFFFKEKIDAVNKINKFSPLTPTSAMQNDY